MARTDLWLTAAELKAWIADYDAAGIDPALPPPQESIDEVRACAFAVCSDLPRSRESAAALGIARVDLCDALFRELELPHAQWRFPRLSLMAWAVLFRVMWTLGFAPNGESMAAGRERAGVCARRLEALAREHGRVVFVGHGALMWLIARRLKRAGWSGPKKSPRRYWEFGVYRFDAAGTAPVRSE